MIMHVDVNRLKGKTVEKGFTGEKNGRQRWELTRVPTTANSATAAVRSPSIRRSVFREILALSKEEQHGNFFGV